jgi:predicted unusual protein kinase regulating ubiquinone biosynthesis (AarF/ABC1/UbiB family)
LQNPGSPKHAFLKEVFENYYQKSDPQDKKAMLASVLRECAAEADPNAPPAAKETLQRQQLMGLIKGAGPFFQKYIQQHSEDFENPEVKKLLATVKRGLAHIPEDLRNANLAVIIKNSGNVKGQAIKGISEVQSLGAASIGEALKMKLTYEDSDKEPEVVVIKMLRPGIAQRASRENLVLKEIAESRGNDAITESYADHASSVEEEMLFGKEYENIKKAGEILNKGAGQNKPYSTAIRAGEVHPAAVGSDRTIMMKLAAGKPMSDHIDALEREGIQDTPEGIARIVNMAKKLQDAYLSMSQSFFRGAVAGSGFFHGDLHSGNVMYDNAEGADLLTQIDWGNAHTLTDVQQKSISRTFAGLVSGDFNFIFDSLQTQLSEEDQRKLASVPEGQQKTVRELVIEAIRDDLPQGSDPPTAVQRLRNSGRALNKIVDKLNGYEISMPSSFIRLVKSQQMLENDINRLQSVINTQLSAEPHAEALKAAEAEKERCEQELMRQLPPLTHETWDKAQKRFGGIKAEFLSDPATPGLATGVRRVLRENLPEDKVDQWAEALAEAGTKYSRIKVAATTARTERVGLIRQANLPDGVGKERTFYGVVYPALSSDLLRAAALLGAGGLDKMNTSGLTPDLMQ